jgi:hypothetical protein
MALLRGSSRLSNPSLLLKTACKKASFVVWLGADDRPFLCNCRTDRSRPAKFLFAGLSPPAAGTGAIPHASHPDGPKTAEVGESRSLSASKNPSAWEAMKLAAFCDAGACS